MSEFWILNSVIFLGFFIQSVFGFGGYLFVVTGASFLIGVKASIPLGIFLSFFANVSILLTDRHSFNKEVFCRACKLLLPGIIISGLFFQSLDQKFFDIAWSFFLMAYGAFIFKKQVFSLPERNKNIIGFLGGFFSGIFGSSSPLLYAIFGNSLKKSEIRSTFIAFFIVLATILSTIHFLKGSLELNTMKNVLPSIPFIILSTIAGFSFHKRISERFFRKGIGVIFFVTGTILLL